MKAPTQDTGTTGDDLPCAFDEFGSDEPSRLQKVRLLIDTFYDHMDSNPEFKLIRDLHPNDLTHSREKFYLFLVGWLGGPDLYVQQFGHPRLRARHMPFPIASTERDQWLRCMALALIDLGFSGEFAQRLMMSFYRTADWMRNRPDNPASLAPTHDV